MRISSVIKQLEKIKEQEGDIMVAVSGDGEGNMIRALDKKSFSVEKMSKMRFAVLWGDGLEIEEINYRA